MTTQPTHDRTRHFPSPIPRTLKPAQRQKRAKIQTIPHRRSIIAVNSGFTGTRATLTEYNNNKMVSGHISGHRDRGERSTTRPVLTPSPKRYWARLLVRVHFRCTDQTSLSVLLGSTRSRLTDSQWTCNGS